MGCSRCVFLHPPPPPPSPMFTAPHPPHTLPQPPFTTNPFNHLLPHHTIPTSLHHLPLHHATPTSLHHHLPLTTRFGAGHMLTLRVPLGKSEPVAAFVAAAFPGAELREAHGSRLRFQLPPGGACTLARVFEVLAAQGAEQGVEDFSVSQTTLEEVPKVPGELGAGGNGGAGGRARKLISPLVPARYPPARYSCTSLRTRGRRRLRRTTRKQEWGWALG